MNLRKLTITKETIFGDGGKPAAQPITRAVALAVLENPFAGTFVDDLSKLFMQGADFGQMVMKIWWRFYPAACSYGKAAIVGSRGEIEHGAALIHPKLGQPIREALGGGEAIICSNVKIGGPGTSIDIPLAHKDNIWSFDYLDTVAVSLADTPGPEEIVVAIAISDGGRPHPRVGKGRL
jgi:hypothetical protein